MIDPADLRSGLVAALRDIPAVVTLVGSAQNIREYEEEENGDLLNTIFGLPVPTILVVYQGSNAAGGPRSLWQHQVSLIVRTATSPTALFAAIVNGVRTTGGGLPLVHDTIHASYSPMAIPAMRRAFIPVSERSSKDYWEITTSFISRGIE
jgi:hypothetical protein